jgi:hypothetical protein
VLKKEISSGYIINKEARIIELVVFFIFLIYIAVLIVFGCLCNEKMFIILAVCLCIVCIWGAWRNIPFFFKYYFEEEKIVLRLGKFLVKELKYKESKTRVVELTDMGYKIRLFREKFLVVSKKHVDIASILYYADNIYEKVIKEKDVIVIPIDAITVYSEKNN